MYYMYKYLSFSSFGGLHCTKDLTIEHKIRQNVTDVVESCGFNLRINIRSCGDGRMPHTGAKGLHFHTGSGIHGRVGMSKLSGIKMGEVDGFLHPLPEGFVSGFRKQFALVVCDDTQIYAAYQSLRQKAGLRPATEEDIPEIFFKHYPSFMPGTLNVAELQGYVG